MALIPCTACARHIRNAEALCPFCGAEAPPESARVRDVLPPGRLGRSALFHFRTLRRAALAGGIAGATLAGGLLDGGLLVGCGGELYGGPPPEDIREPSGSNDIYGGPPVEEEPADQPGAGAEEPPAEEDPGSMVEAYGAPAPPDDGPPTPPPEE